MSSIIVSSVARRVKAIKFAHCGELLSPQKQKHHFFTLYGSSLLSDCCDNKSYFNDVNSNLPRRQTFKKPNEKCAVINACATYQTEWTCQFSSLTPAFRRGISSSVVCRFPKEESDTLNKLDKVIHVKLKAQRLDAVLKAGLGLSRNKVEKALYDDRVRVNGKRPVKKSQDVYEGDEIDVVRGLNQLNPERFIDVSRVEIMELKVAGDAGSDDDSDSESDAGSKIQAVLRRSKSLTIKNYSHAWKTSSKD